MSQKGVIAAGHEKTAEAAKTILENGGNAFDAIVAAHFAACVCEPVLASLGGGGYLLAQTPDQQNTVYDFFVQTPKNKRPADELDFYPITADFGTAQQEFHIGRGSIATPGTVKGLFSIHQELCSMPMTDLIQPAVNFAKNGVVINHFQSYIFEIIQAIYTASPESFSIYKSLINSEKLIQEHEILYQPHLADTLEELAKEGDTLFYQGDIAQLIIKSNKDNGGHINSSDLKDYETKKYKPLTLKYRDATIYTNPPPSSGGILIAFALKLLEGYQLEKTDFGSIEHLQTLINVMSVSNKARIDKNFNQLLNTDTHSILDGEFLSVYKKEILNRAHTSRGTTHISVMDKLGNMASLTTSNGEGCGYILNGTGIMLNNMLGVEDLNSHGFQQWQCDQRMSSMMSPTFAITANNSHIALGSGGSNRIRTAILQVLINLIDYNLSLRKAVNSPRVHFENKLLSIEHGYNRDNIALICKNYTNTDLWKSHNLFFGGVHAVMNKNGHFSGSGDIRRGGVSIIV